MKKSNKNENPKETQPLDMINDARKKALDKIKDIDFEKIPEKDLPKLYREIDIIKKQLEKEQRESDCFFNYGL